jgi:hypothetical protein
MGKLLLLLELSSQIFYKEVQNGRVYDSDP